MLEGRLKLSILDQSPVGDGETPALALQHTVELAQRAEEWGYHRFWVAEHHGSPRNMGSAPEVLMGHLLARTSRIRIGSGGVMLQHYSPYKVAENFNVLAALAPGRVDLGIGRGPGECRIRRGRCSRNRRRSRGASRWRIRWQSCGEFLGDGREGLQAMPLPPEPADLFLLGTTAGSGLAAAQLGLPYVFAYFLNGDEEEMRRAVAAYRDNFDGDGAVAPPVMLALPVMVADTAGEAAEYAAKVRAVRISLESGRSFTVFSEAAAREFGRQSGERFSYAEQASGVIHGEPAAVAARLYGLAEEYRVGEVLAVTAIPDFGKRLRSYELLMGGVMAVQGSRV